MKWVRLLGWLMLGAACSAQAQIAFRAAAQASQAAGGTGGITFVGAGASASRNNCGAINPAIPGGNVNDVLIALVNIRESAAAVTMAGWTQAYADNSFPASADIQARIFYRLATGGDPNTVSQSGTCSSIGAQIARFRGVDTTQPLESHPIPDATNVQRQTNVNNVDTGTQTTTVADSMLLVAAFLGDDRTVTQGAGWSQAFDSALNLTRDLGLSLHYQLQPTTGTFSVSNWAHSGGSTNNYGIIFALRPGSPASPLTINVPAGTAANDVMIASITMRPCSSTSGGNCTTTFTAPPGWNLVGSIVDQETGAGTGGFGHRLAIYQKVATGSEPASYTWSFGGTPLHAGAAGGILSFSGVDTTNPIVASAGATTAAQRDHVAPDIDTGAVTNTALVNVYSVNSSGAWSSTTGTEQVDIASLTPPDDLGLAIGVYTESIPAAGPTGTRTGRQPLTPNPAYDTGATYSLALRPAVAITHYSIGVSASTVANCDYVEVTIAGHDASHAAVNVPSGRTVTLTTSTGTGVWQAGLVAGTGTWLPSGSNNGSATYTWPGGESGFTVRLRQSAVTSLSINLNDGSATEGGGLEDPSVSFVNSVFRISNGSNAALSIGTQIAGKPSDTGFGSQNLFLQAIRTDTSTGACVSLFPKGGDVSVDVRAQCNNPATCAQNLTVSSSAASSNSRSFVPGTAFGAMNFRFTTDNGEAPFVINYADAGQLTLEFRAALPSPPANQVVQGSSNAFVTRPFGFAFRGANEATAIAHGVDQNSTVLAAAGDNFTMTLGAYRWSSADDVDNNGVPDAGVNIRDNGLTPNFAATTTVEVHPTLGNLAGVAGSIARAGGGVTIAAGEWSGGAATVSDWRYTEVGNVYLRARSTDYLGDTAADLEGHSGNDGAASGYVGRFRPKHFALSAASVANRSDLACGGAWTYMGERFRLVFTLTAQNAQNATTTNYTGVYAKLNPATFANWALGARDGTTNLTPRIDTSIASTAAGSWSNGVASNVTLTTNIQRNTPDNPDGPFTAVNFGITPSDGDTPTPVTMNTLDFDADNNSVNERKNLGVATEVRFGRLRMDNVVGSEQLALPIRMEAQYWAGAGQGFQRNTGDSCTRFERKHLALGPYTGNLNACETIANKPPDPAVVTFASGLASVNLSAPGLGNDGTVAVRLNLGTASGSYCEPGPPVVSTPAESAAMRYLRGRWTGATWDEDPSARAAFGLYGGQPNNFIYFRENF